MRVDPKFQKRALKELAFIHSTIDRVGISGQTPILVTYLLSLYDEQRFKFGLRDLRALDTRLADACIIYLDYSRYNVSEVDLELPGGEKWLIETAKEFRQWKNS